MRPPAIVLTLLLLPLAFSACGECEPTPASPPAESWGEVQGGLALCLEAPAESLASADPMVLRVHAKNAGPEALKLSRFEDQTWWFHVRFENLGEGPDFQGGAGLFVDFAEPPDATLAPGATWSREADLTQERRRYLRIIENRKPGDDWDYRDQLPPGRYRAWVEYAHQGREGEGFWAGRVRSNEIEVTVTE